MPSRLIAALIYPVGLAMVGYMFKKRRFSLMISWPYVLYGLGYVIPLVVGDRPEFAAVAGLYSDRGLMIGSLACCSAVLIFLVCDLAILGKRNLVKLLTPDSDSAAPIVQIVNDWPFGLAIACDLFAYAVIYVLAWRAGEIGKVYTFVGLESNSYSGPLSVALELLIALALLYVYAVARYGRRIRRRRLFEVVFVASLIARAIPGYRLALVKSTILCLMLLYLILQPTLKQMFTGLLMVAVVYGVSTRIGFQRVGSEGSGDWFDYVFFLAAETYFGTLPVMKATENLTDPRYQPGLPVAIVLYLIPRFAGDKVGWSESFYNRNLFTGVDDDAALAPVGGMSFLADSMIAYGPFFLLPVTVLAAIVFYLFRHVNSSWQAMLMIAILSGSHQLWRESYANGIKAMVEPYLLQYLVLWLVTFAGLTARRASPGYPRGSEPAKA